ncbi:glycine--tRNA ligase subunit beta [bacterium endosymbiont of Pedicinus badii]|uniref:glycine--tRNA ligase subunit beta n=1 Tax=bacterium endosymbiont of Pedicinus badii TaxID=1719126 RepID=UPI0009BAB2BF|nr:glycine--tRNA ligase subunit beta [bacterium endosymbiont of Pedicinus badii]OQM34078.1 hypothetical protein AOQ89_01840 [bacterium endosymbiont of Pedicinus badii]
MKKFVFLLEIGTEEIPSKSLQKIAKNFLSYFKKNLKKFFIKYKRIYWYASPTRIAIKVSSINFKIDKVQKISNYTKNKKVIFHIEKKNFLTLITKIFQKIITFSVQKISSIDGMYWYNKNFKFVRRIKTVTCLLNKELLSIEIMGISSNRIIAKNKFFENSNSLSLKNAQQYPKFLEKNCFIIPNLEKRKRIIKHEIKKIEKIVKGVVRIKKKFLEEIASLVEYPVAILGRFEKKFLALPNNILIHILQNIQKYFPVYDQKKILLPFFIFITNKIENLSKMVVLDHEKFLNSKLKDTIEFFEKDAAVPIVKNIRKLKNLSFGKNLGSMMDKTRRMYHIARYIAKNFLKSNFLKKIGRAILLSKCDLVTKIVFEYPELQGIAGMCYAKIQGEEKNIYLAQKEQYHPRFLKDSLPKNNFCCVIAVSEKVDNIVGCFIENEIPNSKKDPFSLRRLSIGIINILINKRIFLNFKEVIKKSIFLYKKNRIFQNTNLFIKEESLIKKIIFFIFSRLKVILLKKKYQKETINSIFSLENYCIYDIYLRIHALQKFYTKRDRKFFFIIKRIFKILKNQKISDTKKIQNSLFESKFEKKLFLKILEVSKFTEKLYKEKKYQKILCKIEELYLPIEKFFKNVVVFTKEKEIKENRILLLNKIKFILLKFGHFQFFL